MNMSHNLTCSMKSYVWSHQRAQLPLNFWGIGVLGTQGLQEVQPIVACFFFLDLFSHWKTKGRPAICKYNMYIFVLHRIHMCVFISIYKLQTHMMFHVCIFFSTLRICVCLYTIWYTIYAFSIEQVGCPWLFMSRKVSPQKNHPKKTNHSLVRWAWMISSRTWKRFKKKWLTKKDRRRPCPSMSPLQTFQNGESLCASGGAGRVPHTFHHQLWDTFSAAELRVGFWVSKKCRWLCGGIMKSH